MESSLGKLLRKGAIMNKKNINDINFSKKLESSPFKKLIGVNNDMQINFFNEKVSFIESKIDQWKT